MKIFSGQPSVHAPGAYTPLFQAVAAHELGDLGVDVTALEVEDAVAETVADPGVEVVQCRDRPRDDEVVDSGQGLGAGVDNGDVVQPERLGDGGGDDGLLADAVAKGEVHLREEDREGDAGEAAAGADVQYGEAWGGGSLRGGKGGGLSAGRDV